MDRDTDLFVQGFWVKCRDVIRPELDLVIDDLKGKGHDAHVATQEYSPIVDKLPEIGPVLTLTVHPNGAKEAQTLRFHGDVAKRDVEVIGSGSKTLRHDMSVIDTALVRREIADWLAAAIK